MTLEAPKLPVRRTGTLKPLALPNAVRNMGIHIVAGKGSGKSRLMGRMIAAHDFAASVPLVIFDPHGTTIDNFLDKLTYLTADQQRRIAPRLVYLDMSGKSGFVPSLPLYYRLPGDSLADVAQRFLQITLKLDPSLTGASILGWNALKRVGTNTGMVLAALGLQITEAHRLLRQPEAWVTRLQQLASDDPETKPAVDYFLNEYLALDVEQRKREAESFLSKVMDFTHDARMQAMFAAGSSTVDWEAAIERRNVVLIDFRDETDDLQIRFKMLWLLNGLLEYIKRRGPTRERPVSLIIDELAYLLALNSSGHDLLTADLDVLINKIARNNNVWLTLAHQEMYQLPESIQQTLMTMGTQIIGLTTDEETALALARRYFRFDPHEVKRYQRVYHQGVVIDHTPVELTADEQARLNSELFTRMQPYQFWVAPCPQEGGVSTTLIPTSTAAYDAGRFVNESLVSRARQTLATRSTPKLETTLVQIQERQAQLDAQLTAAPAPGGPRQQAHPQAHQPAFVPPPRKGRRKGSDRNGG